MTRKDYSERVLAAMRRVTKEERAAIRAELDAHMEDHICDLLELGYNESLAEERTMMRMGDPEEVGRELDKQYPLRWLLLGRIAVGITVAVCIMSFLGFGILSSLWWSLEARFFVDEIKSGSFVTEHTVDPDIRIPVGNDILRIYRVSVGERDGKPAAEVSMCAYDRIPWRTVSEGILDYGELSDQRGRTDELRLGGGGKSNYGADYATDYIQIEPGDTYVNWTYDRFGTYVTVEIPLPKEVEQNG